MRVMVASYTVLLALATVAAACRPGDDTPEVDAGEGAGGLTFRWTAPALGAQVGAVRLDHMHLQLSDLRVIGDAAPGDGTYLASAEFDLERGEVPELRFDQAPPGRYSAFEFDLERRSDGDTAWDLLGSVEVGGEPRTLEIGDEQSLSISLPLDGLDLAASRTTAITIAVDVTAVVADVDWDTVQVEDNVVAIETDDPLMPGMRQRLGAAFSVASIE